MKKLLPLFIFLLIALAGKTVCSQGSVVRLEFSTELNTDIYQVVPVSDNGLLVFYETKEVLATGMKSWFFTYYNTSLEKVWETSIPVVLGAEFEDYDTLGNKVYLFFLNRGKIKTSSENFQITTLEFPSGVFYHMMGVLPDEAIPASFRVAGQYAVAGLNLNNDRAGIYFINLQNFNVKEFLVKKDDQDRIEEIQPSRFFPRVDVVVTTYLSRRLNRLYLYTFTQDGEMMNEVMVDPVLDDKFLNTGRVYEIDSLSKMLLGTYGNEASKIPSDKNYFGTESAGVYATRIDNGQQQFMDYYNFLEFQNLRTGVSARDYYRLQRKKIRDNEEYSLNYELVVHGVKEHNGRYFLFGEAYYPDFRTVSDVTYDYWGRPVTQTYTVFEGYVYFTSMLAVFDPDGNFAFDNSIEIGDVRSWSIRKVANYFFDGDPTILYYVKKDQVAYSAFLNDAELEGLSLADIDPLYAGDKVMESNNNHMVRWYGNNFICYGEQIIRNNLIPQREKRTVFYINKITFE